MDVHEFIFQMYKEQPIQTRKFREEIMKKYNLSNDEARDIFVRIHNYQANKYGERLSHDKGIHSTEELIIINKNARSRNYARKKYEEKVK